MEINRNNYEAYLLDLLEGRLSAEDQQKIRDFLLLNPDCANGIDKIEPWFLEKSSIPFPDKGRLKKVFPDASSILDETNFGLFSIARLEGDLTMEQERDHVRMVKENKEKKREWGKWQRTKFVPDNIVFKEKDQLKRKKGISRQMIWITIASSAAVVALLLALFRIDHEATEMEFATGVELPQPAVKETAPMQASDPISRIQKVPLIQQKEAEFSADKTEVFASREQSVRPEESLNLSDHKNAESVSTTVKQVHEDKIQPGAVKIAHYFSDITGRVDNGMYDRIESLEIPSTSIHLTSLSLSQLAEIDLQEALKIYTEVNNFSFWTIADAGIKGINRLTGTEMSLMAARNEEGGISGFRFKSKRISITTPLDQSE